MAFSTLNPLSSIALARRRINPQPSTLNHFATFAGGWCLNLLRDKVYSKTMMRLGKIAVCLASGLVLNASAHADGVVLPNNPYAPAVVRNVFGLNPPQPVDLNAPQADPPPKITLNGIMSIFGHLQALFKVAVPAKPGQTAKDESYILSEGQRQDEIEVIKIDEKNSLVTFNNHGTVQEMALAKANAPVVNAAPGGPAIQGAGDNSGRGRLGGRPGGGGFGAARNRGAGNDANQNPNLQSVPPYAGHSGQPQPQNTIAPEVQMIMIAAQHAKAQQEGDPIAAIYPPTPIDADAGVVPPPPPK